MRPQFINLISNLGLGFHELGGLTHVFVVTLNDITKIDTSAKDVKKTVLDDVGCDFGCAVMCTNENGIPEMIVARKEAIYYYGLDGRGPCSIVGGIYV